MKAALSQNEMEILDRHLATLTYHLSEIASMLQTRLGETNEMTVSARSAQREFARFANRVRRQSAVTALRASERSQTA